MTMPEIRDPAIKLFGKTIALPANDGGAGEGEEDKGLPNKENTIPSNNREQESPISEEKSEPVSSIADGNHKNSSSDEQDAEPENSPNRQEEEQNDSKNQQEKTLKKPDKILPCPRCNSLDTKFCYYNNYNVNQPRHFCKNCQRYWTAGGTMRNVPVGAGRRKNKNTLASHYRHLAVSDVSLLAIPDQMMNPSLRPNGTVLSFGPEAPLCDSMDSVLNLTEKATKSCHQKGFHRAEEQIMEEQSSMSSVTPSKCNDEGAGASVSERVIQNCQGFAPPVPYPNGSPWPFPWNPPPAICAPTYPMPFYPAAAYWGCTPWSLPWLQPLTSPSPTSVSSGSGPSSPALGKHSREEGVLPWDSSSEKGDSTAKQSNQEGCRLWIPKTLRIHDPEEAAKSSVWATMGFKNDKTDGGGQGFFKGFQLTKGDPSRTYLGEASQALHANPAALSRSVSFQESS